MEPSDVVLKFLESVGRRSEAEFYLALFRSQEKERFATIAVDGTVARHALDAVVLDLRFLAALGLTPVVVLGLFEPNDVLEHATRIRRRLEKQDVPAAVTPLTVGPEGPDSIVSTVQSGKLPIVPFGPGDGKSVDERFLRLGTLLASMKTRKLIFLHRRGGLRLRGALVPLVNLTTDYEELAASPELSKKQQLLLSQSRRLALDLVSHKLLIAVTSPLELLRELFTVKGAGTLLRRGFVIERKQGLVEVDRERLRALLTSSFGRAPVEEFFARPVSRVYLEENYRGAAVVADTPLGGYLTKFAVDREAQGEGMGRDLWDLVTSDYPTLIWRARPKNPIHGWYANQCDGMVRLASWHVFWKGLPHEKIPEAVAHALAAPMDIPPPPAGA
ncbi:MAG: hypothetical protein HY698_15720 [Deltaproteobacteria bacterium]|nr:hypothetical protein [Deltaproteobacteria bacterium]